MIFKCSFHPFRRQLKSVISPIIYQKPILVPELFTIFFPRRQCPEQNSSCFFTKIKCVTYCIKMFEKQLMVVFFKKEFPNSCVHIHMVGKKQRVNDLFLFKEDHVWRLCSRASKEFLPE